MSLGIAHVREVCCCSFFGHSRMELVPLWGQKGPGAMKQLAFDFQRIQNTTAKCYFFFPNNVTAVAAVNISAPVVSTDPC